MIVYIVKVFEYDNGDYTERDSWQQIGAYASMDTALNRIKEYLKKEFEFYLERGWEATGTAEEIATALKLTRYSVEYLRDGRDNSSKEIEIERLEVEE